MRKAKGLGVGVVSFMLFLSACGQSKEVSTSTASKAKNDEVLNIVENGEISTLDSSHASDGYSFGALNNVMEGLYMPGPDGEYVPAAAETYKVSDDGLTYTFTLRDSKWSNGDPVTAKDFEYAWKRAVDPKTASEYAFIMYDIKNAEKVNSGKASLDELGVKAIDDKTLQVTLEKPVPYFIGLLGFGTFYPLNEKYVESQGENYGKEADTTIYNGPFALSEWKHDESYQMEKNPNYWDAENVKLNEINVHIVKEISTAVNLYETGEVDQLTINSEYVDKYKEDKALKEHTRPSVSFLRLNEQNKILANANVRKAFGLTIDRKGITDTILNDGSIPANGIIPSGFVNGPDKRDFRETSSLKLTTDVDKAKTLWKQGLKELGQDKVTLDLLTTDDSGAKKVAEYIQSSLEENLQGLTVNITSLPVNVYLENEEKGDYDFSLSSWGADYPDPMTFLDMFVTNGSFNQMNYSNKEYDKLIEEAGSTLLNDLSARWDAYQKAEKILVEDDAAIVPIYQAGLVYLQRTNVKDVVIRPFAGIYSYKWASIAVK